MKHRVIILGLLMALFLAGAGALLAGGEEGQKLIETKYLAGRAYFRSGNYEAAIKEFEEVIKLDPSYKVAREYLKVARAKTMIKSEEVIALHERTEGLKKVMKQKEAKAAERESDVSRMKESWRKWVAREEEKKQARREKKKELARLKREKELAHYYQIDELEKISQESQEMIARAEKGKALQEKKESERWVKLENLPSPQKEKAMSRVSLAKAEAAYKDGNYDEAIKEWEKASSIDPANTLAQKRIEQVRQMIEKNKEAEFNKARLDSISQAQEAVRNYCQKGKYLYGRRDYKGSVEEYQKALAIDLNSASAQKGLAKAERVTKAKEFKAMKVMKAKELKAASEGEKIASKVSGLVNKGDRYLGEKKYSKARALALKALELAPDSREAKELLRQAEEGLSRK